MRAVHARFVVFIIKVKIAVVFPSWQVRVPSKSTSTKWRVFDRFKCQDCNAKCCQVHQHLRAYTPGPGLYTVVVLVTMITIIFCTHRRSSLIGAHQV